MDTLSTPPQEAATGANPLKRLLSEGQSPWLDFIRRGFLADGSLKRLVDEDGLGGVTSNPSIFEKAMGSGTDYDEAFKQLAADGTHDAAAIYETMAVADIQHATEILRPVYERSGGLDGFVSLEVSPYLALREEDTVAEAHRLWAWVDRPNLMVKVPGTPQCVPAIRQLIADGININVTLLFSIDSYKAVAEAYVAGLEERLGKGEDIRRISSVASFFVSRIDAQIDKKIDERVASGDAERAALTALRGKVAIANAKLAYVWYQAFVAGERWAKLKAAGANPQRLLWASTGTKDHAYSDVRYVEELIGRDTVNTIPPATMDAFRDHGHVRPSLTEGVDEARHVLAEAERLGLDLPAVTKHLVADGVRLFADAADGLLLAVARKRASLLGSAVSSLKISLPEALDKAVDARLDGWRAEGLVRKLWARDAGLWTGGAEAKWLAWLDIVQERLAHADELIAFQREVQAAGFTDVLLLGMGGSSLGPEVFSEIFGQRGGWPKLLMHRFEQIRWHAGAEYPEGVFLGAHAAGGGRGTGRGAFRRGDRPWIAYAEGGRGRQIPPCVFRQPGDWWPLLGFVQFRAGAGGGDRDRYQGVSAIDAAHGAVLLGGNPAAGQSWCGAGRHSGRGAKGRA
jgi:transaldolase/glucose-6-phosphate isomerase